MRSILAYSETRFQAASRNSLGFSSLTFAPVDVPTNAFRQAFATRLGENQHPALKPGFNGGSNPRLFEQLPQILKHGVFFVRARAIGEKELLAQVQCLSLHCSGIKPIPYRSQESISVALIFCRVPCVINRSHIELIEWYFRVPIELRDRIRDQPVLREEDQIVGVHAIV